MSELEDKKKLCSYPNCSNKHLARGLCNAHYLKLKNSLPKKTECRLCKTKEGAFNNHNTCRKCADKLRRTTDKDKISLRNKRYYSTPKGRYNNAKSAALKNNKEWTLAFEDYAKLIKNNCYYCNNSLTEFGSGLDRIDNKIGYILSNVHPCCGFCNILRGDLVSPEELKVFIAFLKTYRAKENIWEGYLINGKLRK